MKNYYYSAKQNIFIASGSRLLNMDEFNDAIAVSNEVFNEYFRTVNDGKQRIAGANGLPVWEVIPPPTDVDIKANMIAEAERTKLALKASADTEIEWRQDAVDAQLATKEEADALAEWKKYRVLLMRVETSKAPDIEWPILPGQNQ